MHDFFCVQVFSLISITINEYLQRACMQINMGYIDFFWL